MNLKKVYKTLAIFSILLGVTILITLQSPLAGAVILKQEITPSSTAIFSSFFIIAGLILYYLQTLKK